MDRKALANETLKIMKQGWYECQGQRIAIEEWQQNSIHKSQLIRPEEAEEYGKKGLKGQAYTEKCYAVVDRTGVDHEIGACNELDMNYEMINACNESDVNHQMIDACNELDVNHKIDAGDEPDVNRKINRNYKRVIITVQNADTVACIHESAPCAVLNFASAKNPGGGFLNGALAQEDALAAAGGLYYTLTKHQEYYNKNRACGHMVYTNHAIYSPDVVFFRNAKGELLQNPSKATVLTMPAVNLGQVILHGGDVAAAKAAMKERMRMILGIFAAMGDRNLILGAYGCGVFRNDPFEVARWWKELLEEGYAYLFDTIVFAVYDRSKSGNCIRAFEEEFDTWN